MKNITFTFFSILLLLFLISATQTKNNFPHGKLKIPCDFCHTTEGWQVNQTQIKFKHENVGYPLSGSHRFASCLDCHKSLVFSHVAVVCADCHTDIHQGQLGVNCSNCHTTQNWENRHEAFEQHNRSSFPLLGVHALVDCEGCHYNQQSNEFSLIPVECKNCHLENFINTTNPNHNLAQFSLICEECHNSVPISWCETNYQHSPLFILKGEHLGADCSSCHETTFTGMPHECFGCHEEDYNSTTEPDHNVFGFVTKCEICHDENNWESPVFDHVEVSGFDLTGVHQTLKCTKCHLNNQVANLSRDCYGCHETDYKNVSDPNHVQNNFDFDCMICHNNISWTPATFDHNSTGFPLTGSHSNLTCLKCHSTGYSGLATDCYSCHSNDYSNVTDPSHTQNNFDRDCLKCHTTSSWSPSTFDHNQTQFPLTGAHVSVDCNKCHAQGFSGISTACFSCHEDMYNSTDDPNHMVAQFPTQCENCHNTIKWNETSWSHDTQYFPIYSGEHHGEWDACTDCHVDPSNYKTFECINCHEHRQSEMDDEHDEVNGYQYISVRCYECHPKGKEP